VNSLAQSKEQLTGSLRQLSSNWHSAKEVWNDETREDFERDFWTEFETSTAATIERLQELIDTINQAEREIP
jgi:hypothetical protein